jgi:NTP pyrophosphatase (non-canonical NTP hydrolase)
MNPLELSQTSGVEDFAGMPGANSFVAIRLPEGGIETVRYDAFVGLLFKQQALPFMKLHTALGCAGEAGELADAIKKEVIYNKPVDRANIVEELGDLRFYLQALMMLYGITEQEVLQQNANKLCVRYKSLRYSDEAAQQRADKEN